MMAIFNHLMVDKLFKSGLMLGLFISMLTASLASAFALEAPSELDLGTHQRNTEISKTFTIKNNGTEILDNIEIKNTLDLEDVKFENVPGSLDVDEQATITLKAKLPLYMSSINQDYEEESFDLGLIQILSDDVQQDAITVKAKAENMLKIQDLDLGLDDSYNGIRGGETVKIKPGEPFTLLLEVKNLFDDGPREAELLGLADIDIKIRFWAEVDERDDDDVIIEDKAKFTLSAEERDEAEIEGYLHTSAKGTYDVTVYVYATDDNGAEYGQKIPFVIEVEKNRHEIVIDDVEVSKSIMGCDRDFDLTVHYSNIGEKDEDEARISVYSRVLEISEAERNIEIRDGMEDKVTFNLHASDDVQPGKYAIEIKSFFADKYQTDESYVFIDLNKCDKPKVEEPEDAEEPSEQEEPTETEEEPEDPVQESVEQPAQEEEPREPMKTDYNQYLMIAIVGLVMLIALSMGLGFMIGRR